MNILILTYEGDMAGSTNSINYLAKGLAQRGHNIYLGCRKESLLYRMAEDSGVQRIPMSFKSKFDIQNSRQISDTVKKYNIQIINAQSSWDRYSSVLARWIFRLPVKLVHTRRQVSESVGGLLQNWLYVSGTDKIVAVSNGVKQSLLKNKIPSDHIEVIYNGTPREKYQSVDNKLVEALRNHYNIKPNDFVIGCVSRKKKQAQILQALKHVPFKTKTIFVGVDEEAEWRELIKNLNGRHEVYFTGIIENHQAINYYPIFSIKVLASTMEGLSQSLLEAMALGVPVVATNYAGNPELIKNKINGLLFPDNDVKQLAACIISLHDDQHLRETLATAARHTAFNDFSIEKTIDQYERFFENLIAS